MLCNLAGAIQGVDYWSNGYHQEALLRLTRTRKVMRSSIMDVYILPYFSVSYMNLFGEGLVLKSLSLDMIKWSVTCCHHVHS